MIFELTKPGDYLDNINEISHKDFRDLDSLIRHLISSFFEANHILILYSECYDLAYTQYDLDEKVRMSLREKLRKLIQKDFPEFDDFNLEHHVNLNLPLFEKRYRWNRGELPQTFQNQLPTFYAKSFVFALDNFQKSLKVISLIPNLPNHLEVKRILKEFDEYFIHLRGVRNSAHHMEDRIRGLGSFNKKTRRQEKIQPKPVNEPGVKTNGGAMFINCLINGSYSFTNDDGSLGMVEISETSLSVFQEKLQQLLNSFKWKSIFGLNKVYLPE